MKRYKKVGTGASIANFIFQRIFRINGEVQWMVHFASRVIAPQNMKIPDSEKSRSIYESFAVSGGCYIQGGNGIEIGEGSLWAPGVKIVSANHSFGNYSWEKADPIKIGRYVWIGANAVVLPEVHLGDYVVVGAGSIVTKKFPAYSILVGNPAKRIGYRCKNCLEKLDAVPETASWVCPNCNQTYDENSYAE